MLAPSATDADPLSLCTPDGTRDKGVSAKLLDLVQKVVSEQENGTGSPSPPKVEFVMHCLRTQNVDYQRIDYDKLKKQVVSALAVVLEQRDREKGVDDKNVARMHEEETAVSSDEEQGLRHDARTETKMEDGTCNDLNASLRRSYEKLQREKNMYASKPIIISGAASGACGNVDDSSKSRKRKIADRRKSTSKSNSSSKRGAGSSSGGGGGEFGDGLGDEKASLLRPVPRPNERYSDLGGVDHILQQIRELVEYPLVRPELYAHLGVGPPRGILLRGPPGTGKSHLANAIAGQLGVNYFRVSAPELVSGMSGESEGRIRDLFRAAAEAAPAIIFMDELDAIAPKRSEGGTSRGMEKRMVAQLLTSMDALDPQYTRNKSPVVVLGATNRPDALDSALRRAGRFDKEILMGVPDELARRHIIKTMTQGMRLSGDFDYKQLARKTPGYVGADVRSLTKEAAVIAINRIFRDVLSDREESSTTVSKVGRTASLSNEADGLLTKKQHDELERVERNKKTAFAELSTAAIIQLEPSMVGALQPLTREQMEPLYVTMGDFLDAIPLVQPSGKREGFAVVPDVSWDDVGAMHEIREEMTMSVLEPIRNPEKFKVLGLTLPAGVLLYGPPGCGKTLLAKAVASESGANFISVKGPELLDKFVGESEKAVRLVFERARSSSPCIVFFDELDSLCPKRGSDGGGSGVSERVVNQLLTEMDGLESRRSVFVIAATNRPELIDPAMMRPGRLDKLLFVPLPSADDRVAILSTLSSNVKFGQSVVLDSVGRSSEAEGFSGADCAALLREAGLAALKEDMAASVAGKGKRDADLCIEACHFDVAFHHVMPSVSRRDQARYDRMRNRMARARTRGTVADGELPQKIQNSTRKIMLDHK